MHTNKKNLFIKILVAISFVLMIVINGLANILPINGVQTGQVSDSYTNLFAPAGLTFSIWGIIYFLLALYTLYQFGVFQKNKDQNKEELFKKVGIYFIITSIANVLWIFSWHYDFIGISAIFIIVILFFLIKIVSLLAKENFSFRDRFFILLPFSIYFAWITIATIANITTLLVSINWSGLGISDNIWTIIILLIGTLIGVLKMLKDKNIFYALVFIWAYLGILIKHLSVSGFAKQYVNVVTTVIICILVFIVFEIFLLFKRYKKSINNKYL